VRRRAENKDPTRGRLANAKRFRAACQNESGHTWQAADDLERPDSGDTKTMRGRA
jgi:hypothetical protein